MVFTIMISARMHTQARARPRGRAVQYALCKIFQCAQHLASGGGGGEGGWTSHRPLAGLSLCLHPSEASRPEDRALIEIRRR